MKWKGRTASTNVEDRRGISKKGLIGGGAGIILVLLIALLGGDLGSIISNLQDTNSGGSSTYVETEQDKELAEFVSVVLADTESAWNEIFQKEGLDYQEPTLVLFTDSVKSACGVAGSSTGPFYCPSDHKVYIDLSFYNELRETYAAPGDFAMAYVIAHEVGHHVQTQLGVMEQMQSLRTRLSETEYNEYSVRLELQADYLAGVWANYAQGRGLLEEGDIEEALNAASAIGDDRIQKQAQGYVVPDSFTHGTSEQRMRWFKKGFTTGSLAEWDTFNADNL